MFLWGLGLALAEAAVERFFSYETESWVKTKTMCPAINNGYAAIYDNDVYFCFKTLDEPFGKIGYVEDTGKIILEKKYDLSSQTIINRIDGICSKCNMLSDCLGGCRSKAIADNLREFPRLSFEDVLYKGQKFCRFYSETEGGDYAKTI
jgi:radical SAM protein with 4Fe4S-binding SPASM domain